MSYYRNAKMKRSGFTEDQITGISPQGWREQRQHLEAKATGSQKRDRVTWWFIEIGACFLILSVASK